MKISYELTKILLFLCAMAEHHVWNKCNRILKQDRDRASLLFVIFRKLVDP